MLRTMITVTALSATLAACGTAPSGTALPSARAADTLTALSDICIGNISNFGNILTDLEAAQFTRKGIDGDLSIYANPGNETVVAFSSTRVAAENRCLVASRGLGYAEAVAIARQAVVNTGANAQVIDQGQSTVIRTTLDGNEAAIGILSQADMLLWRSARIIVSRND